MSNWHSVFLGTFWKTVGYILGSLYRHILSHISYELRAVPGVISLLLPESIYTGREVERHWDRKGPQLTPGWVGRVWWGTSRICWTPSHVLLSLVDKSSLALPMLLSWPTEQGPDMCLHSDFQHSLFIGIGLREFLATFYSPLRRKCT